MNGELADKTLKPTDFGGTRFKITFVFADGNRLSMICLLKLLTNKTPKWPLSNFKNIAKFNERSVLQIL